LHLSTATKCCITVKKRSGINKKPDLCFAISIGIELTRLTCSSEKLISFSLSCTLEKSQSCPVTIHKAKGVKIADRRELDTAPNNGASIPVDRGHTSCLPAWRGRKKAVSTLGVLEAHDGLDGTQETTLLPVCVMLDSSLQPVKMQISNAICRTSEQIYYMILLLSLFQDS
jgi:hypothetical protein